MKTVSHTHSHLVCLARLAAIIACCVIAGCSSDKNPVAVKVDDQKIFADELLKIAAAQEEFSSEKNLQRLAHVTAEELAAERRLIAEGWDSDPQFIQARRRFIRSYVNARINAQLRSSLTVSDEEISEYFEAHRDNYRRPEQVRIALIEISTKTQGQEAAPLAQEIYTTLKSMPKSAERDARFNKFVVDHSAHLASRFQGGDVGYLERNNSTWPAALLEAAFTTSLDAPLGPLMNTEDAYYIFRVLGRREAMEPPLDDFSNSIRGKLLTEKHDQMQREGRKRLVDGIDIEIDESVIRSIASPDREMDPVPASLPIS